MGYDPKQGGVAKLLKDMEAGTVMADDFIRKFIPVLDKFADPAARKASEKNRAEMNRLRNSFALFVEEIHKSGFGEVMSTIYQSLDNLMVALTPVARFLTGAFSTAFHTASWPVRMLIAFIADLNTLIDKFMNSDLVKEFSSNFGFGAALDIKDKLNTMPELNMETVMGGIRMALQPSLEPKTSPIMVKVIPDGSKLSDAIQVEINSNNTRVIQEIQGNVAR